MEAGASGCPGTLAAAPAPRGPVLARSSRSLWDAAGRPPPPPRVAGPGFLLWGAWRTVRAHRWPAWNSPVGPTGQRLCPSFPIRPSRADTPTCGWVCAWSPWSLHKQAKRAVGTGIRFHTGESASSSGRKHTQKTRRTCVEHSRHRLCSSEQTHRHLAKLLPTREQIHRCNLIPQCSEVQPLFLQTCAPCWPLNPQTNCFETWRLGHSNYFLSPGFKGPGVGGPGWATVLLLLCYWDDAGELDG